MRLAKRHRGQISHSNICFKLPVKLRAAVEKSYISLARPPAQTMPDFHTFFPMSDNLSRGMHQFTVFTHKN